MINPDDSRYYITQFTQCLCFCMQGTQKSSGTSHSSSSSQVGSSPKLERRPRTGLHRTVAAVGQTEPLAVIQQVSSGSGRLDSPPFSAAAEMSKSSPERTGSMSLECDSPKDHDFPRDYMDVVSSHTDVRSTVHDGVVGCDGNSSHPLISGRENCQILISKQQSASYCKLHRRKLFPGRRPQSASDIDQCRLSTDCCCVSSSQSISTLEERFNKTLEINMKLAEKLATTCQQMEVLTMKLREFEVWFTVFVM